MLEDKLTRAERIRLEAFAQALNSAHVVGLAAQLPSNVVAIDAEPRRRTMADVFQRAEEIEAWLKRAEG